MQRNQPASADGCGGVADTTGAADTVDVADTADVADATAAPTPTPLCARRLPLTNKEEDTKKG